MSVTGFAVPFGAKYLLGTFGQASDHLARVLRPLVLPWRLTVVAGRRLCLRGTARLWCKCFLHSKSYRCIVDRVPVTGIHAISRAKFMVVIR